MVGNFAAQPETGYETQSAGADSTRGTAMKDLAVGTASTVADIFTVTPGTGSLTFKSGGLTKTVTLADAATATLAVNYSASGKALRVRNGLSPDLATLMLGGQARLAEKPGDNQLALTTSGGATTVTATLRVTKGTLDTAATDKPDGAAWNTVNLRNAPQVRQIDVTGSGALAYGISFANGTARHDPPTISVTPPGVQTIPVGTTTSFRVTAADWQGQPLPVEATELPLGNYWSGTPVWDPTSGMFTWTMGAPSDGTRTDDLHLTATFTATDGASTATTNIAITVPWDADNNGVGDDWDYIARRKSPAYKEKSQSGDDPDGDGFDNYSEWVAGTDPTSGDDYVGWKDQTFAGTNATYTFRSVPGGTYYIESADLTALLTTNPAAWTRAATLKATSSNTTWRTPRTPSTRVYRLRIPFFDR